jgi:hypothetical protein
LFSAVEKGSVAMSSHSPPAEKMKYLDVQDTGSFPIVNLLAIKNKKAEVHGGSEK